jgi:nitrogen fixation/metabolism regulation signal transduction histidine kinase
MASIASIRNTFSGQSVTPVRLRRKLQRKLALRLLGICFFGCLTGFLFFNSPYWMAGIWTGSITVGLFVHTIQFVDSSERKLTAFLQALRQNDFAVTFAENPNADDYDLHRAFNQLNTIFKNLRSERESQHQLLQVVVEQASSPLICFEESNGEVYLMNNAAKQLLQFPFLQKIESLSRVDFQLPKILRDIRDGEKHSLKLTHSGKVLFVSVHASHILFEDRNLKIVTLQDVTSELAAKEADTWHKLLRVLTHEISNSAIPLSTLSSYIYEMVIKSRDENRDLTQEQQQDIMTSLKTIDQRSRTLKEFVQNFRLVGQVPEPRLEKISVSDMVSDAANLFTKEFEKENIALHVSIPGDVIVHADRNLTQQVFINLLKNAMEAMSNMKSGKRIEIHSAKEGHRYIHVSIWDSGSGIAGEDIEQIFIPFFSTKKGGSGIGLSISRQIMQKQRGDITVQSEVGKGSRFRVIFIS